MNAKKLISSGAISLLLLNPLYGYFTNNALSVKLPAEIRDESNGIRGRIGLDNIREILETELVESEEKHYLTGWNLEGPETLTKEMHSQIFNYARFHQKVAEIGFKHPGTPLEVKVRKLISRQFAVPLKHGDFDLYKDFISDVMDFAEENVRFAEGYDIKLLPYFEDESHAFPAIYISQSIGQECRGKIVYKERLPMSSKKNPSHFGEVPVNLSFMSDAGVFIDKLGGIYNIFVNLKDGQGLEEQIRSNLNGVRYSVIAVKPAGDGSFEERLRKITESVVYAYLTLVAHNTVTYNEIVRDISRAEFFSSMENLENGTAVIAKWINVQNDIINLVSPLLAERYVSTLQRGKVYNKEDELTGALEILEKYLLKDNIFIEQIRNLR